MKRNHKWGEMSLIGREWVVLLAMLLTISEYRIQTWALEEARRRLEAEGILPDPDNEAKK